MLKFAILAFLLGSSIALAGVADRVIGTFEATIATDKKSEKRFIEVTIIEKQSKYFLSGSAGYSTGRSVSPDFSGVGLPPKAAPFKFTFEDSFGNAGTAFVTITKSGIHFSATIESVKDARCLPHYADVDLKRRNSG
jgi:hypothetical protein